MNALKKFAKNVKKNHKKIFAKEINFQRKKNKDKRESFITFRIIAERKTWPMRENTQKNEKEEKDRELSKLNLKN